MIFSFKLFLEDLSSFLGEDRLSFFILVSLLGGLVALADQQTKTPENTLRLSLFPKVSLVSLRAVGGSCA